MSPTEDISLFIGILPGAEQRQLVLFPERPGRRGRP